jgi:hypothetical protein
MEYDVKKALKDAKEFIKNKEYTSALDTCKVKSNRTSSLPGKV